MTNHVHLIAPPQHEHSLSRALRHAHADYAQTFNRAGLRSGHAPGWWPCRGTGGGRVRGCPAWKVQQTRCSTRLGFKPSAIGASLDRAGPWAEFTRAGMWGTPARYLCRRTVGSKDFLALLEGRARRRLRVFARGRPPKQHTAGEAPGVKVCYSSMEPVKSDKCVCPLFLPFPPFPFSFSFS